MSFIQDGRTTFLYWLIDPRPNAKPCVFYVGISVHPWWRLHEHRKDSCSAAWPKIQEIENDGYECEIQLLRELEDRRDACELEYRLIALLPELCNRHRPTLAWWRQ